MICLQKVEKENMGALAPYFAVQNTHISDYSAGFQIMWGEALSPNYCICAGCLVLHEFFAGCNYFYYPISARGEEAEEDAALDEIERYCRDNDLRLHFTNVPEQKLMKLIRRYGQDATVNNRRRWRDYLYEAEDFRSYPGRKYSGQRNHVNRFLRENPDWDFSAYREEDEPALTEFLGRIAEVQRVKGEFLAREEMDEVLRLIPDLKKFAFPCGILRSAGKIVGFSAGEICGDMMIVHIEKADKSYPGVYPFLAQQFARKFCGEKVRTINRMDDAGDPGLRKSKLQYMPCELVSKYNLLPRRAIDSVSKLPEIETERLLLAPVREEDVSEYARLARDPERNRYWGYDWRKDFSGEPEDGYFLSCAREDFRAKREMPLGIYREGKLIGEATVYRFGYRAEAEFGIRLLPEAEGFGYAREAMRALVKYAFFKLQLERAEARCFRENVRSAKMLSGAGFAPCGEDDTYFYFQTDPSR